MHRNIFAYTSLDLTYPEYVSVNEQDDGSITIDVRGPVKQPDAEHPYVQCGDTVRMTLPREQLAVLVGDIANYAIRRRE